MKLKKGQKDPARNQKKFNKKIRLIKYGYTSSIISMKITRQRDDY